jgi:hypothetical protein
MNTHEFDNHIREKLGAYQSPVDTKAVWSGVQSKMSSGNSRGGALWWIVGGITLIVAIGTALYNLPERAFSPADAQNLTTTESLLSTAGSTEGLESKAIEHERNETIFASTALEYQPTASSATGSLAASADEPDRQGEQTVMGVSNSEEPLVENKRGSLIAQVDHSNGAIRGLLVETQSSSRKGIYTGRTDGASLDPSVRVPLKTNALSTQYMEMRPAELIAVSPAVFQLRTDPEGYFIPAGKRRPTLMLLADGGIGAAGRQLEAGAPLWVDFTEQRERNEAPLEFVAAQLRLSLQFSSGWFLTSGLSFTQVHERFSINRIRTEEEWVNYISEIFIDEAGDSIFTYSTALSTTTYTERINHINRYSLVDIPVAAGYGRDFGPWNLGFEAGILLNLGLTSRGTMLNNEDVVLDIEDSNMFRAQIGLSYSAGLRIGYHLSSQTMVYLQPGLRYIPGSFTDSAIQRQTYTLYGVQAGVAFKLK